MHYKVVLVHEQTSCCETKSIAMEIEKECNHWGGQGYVLVTAYRQTAAVGQNCNQQNEVGAILIFARRTG